MAYRDLREFLDRLEKEKDLSRVSAEVDWNLEVGTIMRRVYDERGPAVLFERVKDSPNPLVSGAMDTERRYGWGLETDPNPRAILHKLVRAIEQPLKPVLVDDGPCKQHVDTGNNIDLGIFPAPKWHRLDGGRFIGTLGVVVTKDPETGEKNLGICREQIHDRKRTGLYAAQQARIMLRKYQTLGRPMPVATAIGVDPAVLAASTVLAPYGSDEMEIAGALRGQPVELVRCETVDLAVPASAEIVLEGEIEPNEELWLEEGPFGEFTGFYAGQRTRRPTVNLTAVTYRDMPILHGTFEGPPPSESTTLRTFAHTAGIWGRLRKAGVPGVKEVYSSDMGCAIFWTVVSMEQQFYAGNVQDVINVVFGLSESKWVIVVDGDIDIYDRGQVEWALSTRVLPHRDIILTSRQRGLMIDSSIAPEDLREIGTRGSKIGIDGTMQFKGFDFPPFARPTAQEIAFVDRRWPEYEIPRKKS